MEESSKVTGASDMHSCCAKVLFARAANNRSPQTATMRLPFMLILTDCYVPIIEKFAQRTPELLIKSESVRSLANLLPKILSV